MNAQGLAHTVCVLLVMAAMTVLGSLPISAEETGLPLGIRRVRPTTGRFVKTGRGYMVSYTAKIPGTDATFQMVPISGARYRLGSPSREVGRDVAEGPQIDVTIRPFWIGRYEVTWGEYLPYYDLREAFAAFDQRGVRQVTLDREVDAVTAPSTIYEPVLRLPEDPKTRPTYPATTMTQYAARQYTKWLSKLTTRFYRLPSEAEWELACRGGTRTAFSFGNDPAQLAAHAWFVGNSEKKLHPVGRKRPNSWGLFDMHGNAAEWVLDKFEARGYEPLKSAVVEGQPAILWPDRLYPRTVRGGSWNSSAAACRSAARRGSDQEWQNEEAQIPHSPWWLAADMHQEIGFRIVRPLDVPKASEQARYWDPDAPEIRESLEDRLGLGRGRVGLVDPKLPAAIRENARP